MAMIPTTVEQVEGLLDQLASDVAAGFTSWDKVAFVGTDELARTTLFQILMGEMEPDPTSCRNCH